MTTCLTPIPHSGSKTPTMDSSMPLPARQMDGNCGGRNGPFRGGLRGGGGSGKDRLPQRPCDMERGVEQLIVRASRGGGPVGQ